MSDLAQEARWYADKVVQHSGAVFCVMALSGSEPCAADGQWLQELLEAAYIAGREAQ